MATAIQRVEAAEQRLFDHYGLDVTSQRVTLPDRGMDLRVLEVGTGDGAGAAEPLVFLHGEGGVASQWAPLLAALPDHRRFAIDLPGFGLSDGLDYRRVDVRGFGVSVVRELLGVLGLDRAVLVGNSLGGALALWAGLDVPDAVTAVALLGAPAPAGRGTHAGPALAPLCVPGLNRFLLSLPLPPLAVNRTVHRWVLGADALDASAPEVVEVAHHAMDRPTFARSMASCMQSTYRLGRPRRALVLGARELRALALPTLLVWGRGDSFGRLRSARRLADALPHARLHVIDAGHAPWLNASDRCADLLSAFLDGLDGSAGRPGPLR